jgi:vancomycin aglycone glucosyltransferase
MRVLVSSAGTRGDVQPVLALALEVRDLGHDIRLCVPPNFVDRFIERGFDAVPMGMEMRAPRTTAGSAAPLTAEQVRQMREHLPDLITDQFETLAAAAKGCDVILGANTHQYAAPSIAEINDIPYVNAVYAPVVLPSPDHAPPPAAGGTWEPGRQHDNEQRWDAHRKACNDRALERVNHNRTRLGLQPVDDVLRHVLTAHSWLAADPILAPAPATPTMYVTQTGAWILPDRRPLPPELDAFVGSGDPTVYVGFGSMPVPAEASRTVIGAVRAAGLRVILSQGWAELGLIDDGPDCIAIGDVNQQELFPRLAAVVHHGGAGTTVTAAAAGVPQVVLPMFSDQFYFAGRVRALGIGSSGTLTGLGTALREALQGSVASNALHLAPRIDTGGATTAAERLVANYG